MIAVPLGLVTNVNVLKYSKYRKFSIPEVWCINKEINLVEESLATSVHNYEYTILICKISHELRAVLS